jgi:hypothetical protein
MAKYVQNVERMFADELKIPESTVIEVNYVNYHP